MMLEKLITGVAGAVIGAVLTYGAKGISIEGRLDGIERAVIRIERAIENSK